MAMFALIVENVRNVLQTLTGQNNTKGDLLSPIALIHAASPDGFQDIW